MNFKHVCTPENASKFWGWLNKRGGIAVWESINLSNPGASWSTPAKTEDGQPYPKPTWECANEPKAVYTNPSDIGVSIDVEVKRFRVGVRVGSQGMSLKVTDGGTRRIRSEVAKAGDGAFYRFDYGEQQAVIMRPEKILPLAEYIGKAA